jgi:DNA-directed RNA polymerase subunit RPC12/RpoP
MRRTPAVISLTLTLEHQCLQCGAPVSLEETDRIFMCPFCHVRHFLYTEGYFRYYLPPLKSCVKDVFYIPYWRFKGLKIVILGMGNKKHEVVDRSVCAAIHPHVPLSLGFRSQTLTMKFVEPGMSDICFPPVTPLADFMKTIKKVSPVFPLAPAPCRPLFDILVESSVPEPSFEPYCELIGETTSLIYSPFFVRDSVLYDGITGEKLGSAEGKDVPKNIGGVSFPKTAFFPALCPTCGRDLQGEKESAMMACDQCLQVYAPSSTGLIAEEFFVAWPVSKADIWLPFWRIAVGCSNGLLSSVADFYRFAGIPKPILPNDEQRSFHFLIPAFKSNPDFFLKLSKLFTLHLAEIERPSGAPRPLYPITLPATEAFQSIPALLVDTAPAKKRIIALVINSSFSMKNSSLVFVPFVNKGAEFVQQDCNFGINKNALKAGRGF